MPLSNSRKHLFLLFFTICAVQLTFGQDLIPLKNQKITDEALYFQGPKYNAGDALGTSEAPKYRFAKTMNPDGPSSIQTFGSYIYVVWYKGGVDKKNVMLSRRPETGGTWVHIEFPHTHVGYQHNPFIGDSHNYIAMNICPTDNTIHLIYDLHAYKKDENPNTYFNYSISIDGAALVSDSDWNLNLFTGSGNYKRSYLNENEPSVNYENLTYPELIRTDDNRLYFTARRGGAGNGRHMYSYYNGTEWTKLEEFNKNTLGNDYYSIYGSFKFLNGQLRAGFHIRDSDRNPFQYNFGLYYGYFKNENERWYNHTGTKFIVPLSDITEATFLSSDDFMQPNDELPYLPEWTVTKNGAIHFITSTRRIDPQDNSTKTTTYGHYYKTQGSGNITKIPNCEIDYSGRLISYEDYLYWVGLSDNNRIKIKRTLDTESNWEVVYDESNDNSNRTYRTGNVHLDDNKIHYYLSGISSKNDDETSVPLYLATFEITKDIVIEAESYNSTNESDEFTSNPDFDSEELDNASGGKAVKDFSGGDWKEYNFNIETAGVYKMYLTAANRAKEVSETKFYVDSNEIGNFPIAMTGDWNQFNKNQLSQTVSLAAGEHICRIEQMTSLSSKPDRIEFVYKEEGTNLSIESVNVAGSNVFIYPNPANNFVTVKGNTTKGKFEIFNSNGVSLMKGDMQSETQKIDTSLLASGIYFIRISSNKNIFTKTFSKR